MITTLETTMTQTQLVLVAVCSAMLGITSAAEAAPGAALTPCVFKTYAPNAVTAYLGRENRGNESNTILRGARLYVPAREGLTQEWLQLSVQRAFASPQDAQHAQDYSCRPNVHDVEVSVTSAGGGFWVYLGSTNVRSARALLQWAQAQVATSGSGS
jgi:hypothetical protein